MALSVRSFLVSLLLLSLFSLTFTVSKTYAQVINTPTPTPTPIVAPTNTPTPAVATPTTSVLIVTETPTPTLPVTGPAETFALIGLGSIALLVVGSILFFAL